MTSLKHWAAGARPKTLPAAIAPVLVATAFAGAQAKFVEFALSLVVALALQVGVNYANDYSDGVRGTDRDRVGPIRLIGSGLATPRAVKQAALISFSVAAVAGTTLAFRTQWWLILIGAIAIIAAWTYTGGPKPYGYLALGEVSVFLFFGIVATIGTYFVQVGEIDLKITLASIAMGALANSILMANNLRDLETDSVAKKQTLAVRMGANRYQALYQFNLLTPFLVTLFLLTYSYFFLLTALSLPIAIKTIALIRSGVVGRATIPLLGIAVRLQLFFAAALALAALLAGR